MLQKRLVGETMHANDMQNPCFRQNTECSQQAESHHGPKNIFDLSGLIKSHRTPGKYMKILTISSVSKTFLPSWLQQCSTWQESHLQPTILVASLWAPRCLRLWSSAFLDASKIQAAHGGSLLASKVHDERAPFGVSRGPHANISTQTTASQYSGNKMKTK